MKKRNMFLSILIFTILNYLIYGKIIYFYLFQTIIFPYINTPYFLISYLTITAIYVLSLLKQINNKRIHRNFIIFSLIIYIPILIFILFGKSIGIHGFELNILTFFSDIKANSLEGIINILIFIPIGLCIKNMSYKKALLSIGFIISIETVQYLCYLGFFDVADILFNFLGIIIGHQLHLLLTNHRIKIDNIKMRQI